MAFVAIAIAAPQLVGAQGQTPSVVAHDYYFQAPDGSRTPANVTINPGGSVSFGYPSGSSQHDVHFTAGPATPTCTGATPVAQAAFDSPGHTATPQGPGWSGTCSFSAAGDYYYLCTIHPSLMYGVVHVAAPGSGGAGSPAAAPAVSAVAVAASQRGAAVGGSLTLGQGGATLTVDLYASHVTLAAAHSIVIGHVAYGSLSAGRHSFRVGVNGVARRALRRHHRLAVKVKLTVTAPSQQPVAVTRRVTLKR